MLITAFQILLAIVVLYAFLRGGRDERYVGIICIAGWVGTYLVLSPLKGRYESVEMPVMAVDLAVLGGFLVVALRSQRFWPLWVAGLQLTTIMGHFLKGIDSHLLPRAYAVALGFWGYPIVVILAVGVWRSQRRARAEQRQATTV